MPSVSPAQHRPMEAAAHTRGGYGGVPQKVGREFANADEGKDDTMQHPEHDEYSAEHGMAADHHEVVAGHHAAIGDGLEKAAEGHHALAEHHEAMSDHHREKMAAMLQNEQELRRGV